MVYGIWYGGTGYGHGDRERYVECFDSVTSARHALRERRDGGYGRKQDFHYANREAESLYCPCVEDDSSIHLFLAADVVDDVVHVPEYPDLIVEFGPRGGVQVNVAA